MRTTHRTAAVLAAFALVLALASCSSSSKGSSSTGATATNTVTIKSLAFTPPTITVKAGSTITIDNKDSATHTFTSDTGAFDTHNINGGTTKTVTIAKAGTYKYHCSIHSFMKGTIIVT